MTAAMRIVTPWSEPFACNREQLPTRRRAGWGAGSGGAGGAILILIQPGCWV